MTKLLTRPGLLCGAKLKRPFQNGSRHAFCRRLVTPGKNRCHLHGSKSTGPRSAEFRQHLRETWIAAMKEGRRRWVEQMKAAGSKFPCGRKHGPSKAKLARLEAERAQAEAARREALGPAGRAAEDIQLQCARAVEVIDTILAIRA
jgi:hypothetical protein